VVHFLGDFFFVAPAPADTRTSLDTRGTCFGGGGGGGGARQKRERYNASPKLCDGGYMAGAARDVCVPAVSTRPAWTAALTPEK